MNNTAGPLWSATSDTEVLPWKQRKVMTLEVKDELLDKHHRSRSVTAVTCHLPFQDKWNQHKEYCLKREREKRKKRKFVKLPRQLHQQMQKPWNFCKKSFYLILKIQVFLWVQDCYKKGLPIDNMIREKAKVIMWWSKKKKKKRWNLSWGI